MARHPVGVIVAAIALCLFVVAPPAAMAYPPPHIVAQPNDVYAGWSIHPTGQNQPVIAANAGWIVPTIECNAPATYRSWKQSRAAPWIGIWGKSNDPAKTWLIQIATVSQCLNGQVHSNKAYWQLFHESSNGGYTTPGPQYVFDVQPGDQIGANIEFIGSPNNQMQFEALIGDPTASQRTGVHYYHREVISLDAGVQDVDARWQGGCILEAEPDMLAGGIFPAGGLAKFEAPFRFLSCRVNHTTIDRFPLAEAYRWDLKAGGTGGALADTNPLGGDGGFTVTWKAWRG